MKNPFRIEIALVMLTFSLSVFGADQYSSFLKDNGFTKMKTPRTTFGTGTIIGRAGKLKDEPLATPEQCFPGVKDITPGKINLGNSQQNKSIGINAGANFVPGGGGILGSIIGAFGFNKVRNMDVAFGPTTSYDWTVIAFENYLEGKTISKGCYKRLVDKDSKIILSTAEVESMTYTLNGDVKIGFTVNAAMLGDTLKANFGLNYGNVTKNSFTITSPMLIAYKAVSFKDLKLVVPESSDEWNSDSITLTKGAFQIVQ